MSDVGMRLVALALIVGYFVCVVAVVDYFIADAFARTAACALVGVVSGATVLRPFYDAVSGR